MTEDQLQSETWREAWNNYPHLRKCFWAVPNSAIGNILNLKDVIQSNKMKATGLLEGVWDIHLFYKNQFFIFEFKIGKNNLTVDRIDKKGKKHYGQKEWGELMVANGAKSYVIRAKEEFFAVLDTLVP